MWEPAGPRLRLKEHLVGTSPCGGDEVKMESLNRENTDPLPTQCVAPPGLPQGLALTRHPECIAKIILKRRMANTLALGPFDKSQGVTLYGLVGDQQAVTQS